MCLRSSAVSARVGEAQKVHFDAIRPKFPSRLTAPSYETSSFLSSLILGCKKVAWILLIIPLQVWRTKEAANRKAKVRFSKATLQLKMTSKSPLDVVPTFNTVSPASLFPAIRADCWRTQLVTSLHFLHGDGQSYSLLVLSESPQAETAQAPLLFQRL